MHGRIRTHLLGTALLVLAGIFVSQRAEVRAAAAISDDCDAICGSSALCGENCFWYPDPQGPGQDTTCGEYDGGASNGWCDGDTCASLCSSSAECDWECYADGEATECGAYNGGESGGSCTLVCGDGICSFSSPHNEDPSSCSADCGYCGDGFCSWLWEDPTNCSGDCSSQTMGSECDAAAQDCSGGDVCSAAQYCIDQPACSYCCTTASDCGGGETCQGYHPDLPGYGWCLS